MPKPKSAKKKLGPQDLIDAMLYEQRLTVDEARTLRPKSPLASIGNRLSEVFREHPELLTWLLDTYSKILMPRSVLPPGFDDLFDDTDPRRAGVCSCGVVGCDGVNDAPGSGRPIGVTLHLDEWLTNLYVVPTGLEDDGSGFHDKRLGDLFLTVKRLAGHVDTQSVYLAVPQKAGGLIVVQVDHGSDLMEIWLNYRSARESGGSDPDLVARARAAMAGTKAAT